MPRALRSEKTLSPKQEIALKPENPPFSAEHKIHSREQCADSSWDGIVEHPEIFDDNLLWGFGDSGSGIGFCVCEFLFPSPFLGQTYQGRTRPVGTCSAQNGTLEGFKGLGFTFGV